MSELQLLLTLFVTLVSLFYGSRINDRLAFVMMLPVVVFTLVFVIEWRVFISVTAPLMILFGLLAGAVLLVVLLPLSAPSSRQFLFNLHRTLRSPAKRRKTLTELAANTPLVVYEELIWRLFLIGSLSQWLVPWLAALLAAMLFWFAHPDNRQLGSQSLEFLLFSVTISIVFLLCESFLLVLGMHLARNVLILAELNHDDKDCQ